MMVGCVEPSIVTGEKVYDAHGLTCREAYSASKSESNVGISAGSTIRCAAFVALIFGASMLASYVKPSLQKAPVEQAYRSALAHR